MKIYTILLALAVAVFSGPVPEDSSDESPMEYFLVEKSPGVYEIEDLVNSEIDAAVSNTDLTYHFFSVHNYDKGVDLKSSEVSILKKTEFKASKDTVFVIHGWLADNETTYNIKMRESVLSVHDINVFIVDWSPIAGKNYISARYAVPKIGNYLADFIKSLSTTYGLDLSKVTLIGHSLGAHIAGNAGAALDGKVGKIVGLDPAGPLFFKSSSDRLIPDHAKFVQAIHTNAKLLGIKHKSGHADYYPNGGDSQLGCVLDIAGACSHSRSYEYYVESIMSEKDAFLAVKCSSYTRYSWGKCSSNDVSVMGGFEIDTSAEGDFYLKTNRRSPFALG